MGPCRSASTELQFDTVEEYLKSIIEEGPLKLVNFFSPKMVQRQCFYLIQCSLLEDFLKRPDSGPNDLSIWTYLSNGLVCFVLF